MSITKQGNEAERTHSIRILIVDDDNVNAMLAKSVLERNGCLVQIASNPVKALEKYAREKDSIDLVIIDYFMPSLDGGEAVQHLRKLNPDVKVILFSGAEEMRLRQIMKRYPIDAYIHKPLRMQEALQTIRQVLPTSVTLPVESRAGEATGVAFGNP
ncbi:MAG TPA: response regulator [Verrucomicrobiae bacterium]|nr:response regulator [Verrucomicrobiae bacterium]